jgi:hypothetical protein
MSTASTWGSSGTPPAPCSTSPPTQAEWGGLCAGAGAGCYLETNFDACLDDLVLGCTAGWTVTLTSAGAVSALLPTDGAPASLAASYVDPALDAAGGEDPLAQATDAGEFLGQTVALALNLYFDGCDLGFGSSETPLADLVVCDPASPLSGWPGGEVLAEANAVLGGCGSGAILPEQLNAALKAINENFVPGSSVGSYLCPAEPGGGGGGE